MNTNDPRDIIDRYLAHPEPPKIAPFIPIRDPMDDYVLTPFGFAPRGQEHHAWIAVGFIMACIGLSGLYLLAWALA